MKFLLLLSICISVSYALRQSPNSKRSFCQENHCLTCVGRYCVTTCRGNDCRYNCSLGDCCDSTNCNICRGDNCCSTLECNTCVQTCLTNCQEKETCHYDCFERCSPITNRVNNSSRYSIIKHYNYMPVNVTTIINITNTINNTQSLYNPVIVNNTYINNHTVHEKVFLNPRITHKTNSKFNCCDIVHPEKCESVEKHEEILCSTAKHRECSKLCISNYVHIIYNQTTQENCLSILVPPYNICGHYSIENCASCYNCPSNNRIQCMEGPDCRKECVLGIIPETFYNNLYRKDKSNNSPTK